MVENWRQIEFSPEYDVSDHGRVRSNKTGRILALSDNQSGLVHVGLMHDGKQYHRSVPLMVAKAFLPRHDYLAFDTPINLDGDRFNNHIDNLVWRPRWFAKKYNQQFRQPYRHPIHTRLIDMTTGDISENSVECAKRYGLLEEDLVLSVLNRTYVWPTYQQFGIME